MQNDATSPRMGREKDLTLAGQCHAMAKAATQALEWFDDNQKLVGYRHANLSRMFKKHALEALKLAHAAERPMSVGVFGASQTGKSFLTGSFIAPKDNPVKVVFGNASDPVRMDFLDEVNPAGGDETTGLVTRFSIHHRNPPSPDYPVRLRLLSEGDIIKILANTFTLDLRARADREFKHDRLQELVQAAEGARRQGVKSGLSTESALDVEQYIQEELEDHPLNGDEALREEYWLAIERLAPELAAADRAALVAPLWGEIPEFTELYIELVTALDAADHPEYLFTRLDAIRDRRHGVLHVQTIYHLDPETTDGAYHNDGVERITVMSDKGRTTELRKAIATALTAELQVTLEEKPWDFLEHTDLLDFPGARGRESKAPSEFLRGEEFKPQNRAYCFLRGKIAVLFDKYSAELDLNTMLLCSDDSNQEVRKLAELVHRWVARTHGPTPEDRRHAKVAMVLCLTKADRMFDRKAGASLEETIQTRINKDVVFYQSWTKEWAPGKPFDNIVFARNPKFARDDLFTYEAPPADAGEGYIPPETGLTSSAQPFVEKFKQTFLTTDVVQQHVADPEAKIDAILELNDGGITYIARQLAPTCDPDLKYDQITPRAQALSKRMRSSLGEFYEAGDIQKRIAERRAEALRVVEHLKPNAGVIGQLIAALQTDEETMGAVYLEAARGELQASAAGDGDPEDAGSGSGQDAGSPFDFDSGPGFELEGVFETVSGSADDDGDADSRRSQGPLRQGLAAMFGEAAVRRWLLRIEDAAQNSEYAQTFGLDPSTLSVVVQELEIAARRYRLAEAISDQVGPIIQYHQRPDEHMHRVAMVSSLTINHLVSYLGRDRADAENQGMSLFHAEEPALVDGLPDLPADKRQIARTRGAAIRDWLNGLVLLAAENAAASEGGVIDVEQNARMGRILDLVASQVGE